MKLNYSGSGIVFYNKKEYKCNLYTNKKQGGILIQINVNNAFASYLELPLNIKFLSGELSTGYKFSLISCSRDKMVGLVSEGRSVFTYYAQYMFEGIGGKDYKSIKLSKVIFGLSDIIEWGSISGYSIGEDYQIKQNKDTEKEIFKNDNINIKYFVEESMLPIVSDEILQEKIILKQNSNIEISFKKEETIEKYYNILKKIKRLIEMSILSNIHLNKIIGWSKDVYDMYGEQKVDRAIEIISNDLSEDIISDSKDITFKKWKLITLPELIENSSFEQYFNKYEFLEPIIELYLEIIKSNKMSDIRVFLNVVQALETYHSRFKANNIKEFINRIDTVILKDRPKKFIESDKKFLMANSKGYITLESRIADLLIAEFNIRFDTGKIRYLDFPQVIAKTRNYYIHYDESIKGKVLTEEELSIYNHTMIYMLEYYLLIELGFSNISQVREKLNERWGNISKTLSLIEKSKKIEKCNSAESNSNEIEMTKI